MELIKLDEAVRVADIVVLLVNHAQFKPINLDALSGKQVINTRGVWSVNKWMYQNQWKG